MRTTVRIDDDLYRAVKERAARTGPTVAVVLEDAVRLGLNPPARTEATPYQVHPSGSGGLVAGIDLTSNASVREAMDQVDGLDALR